MQEFMSPIDLEPVAVAIHPMLCGWRTVLILVKLALACANDTQTRGMHPQKWTEKIIITVETCHQ